MPLAHLAARANLSRMTLYRARKGYLSERTRNLLCEAIAFLSQGRQVWQSAHRSTIEELSDVTGFRT